MDTKYSGFTFYKTSKDSSFFSCHVIFEEQMVDVETLSEHSSKSVAVTGKKSGLMDYKTTSPEDVKGVLAWARSEFCFPFW